MKTKKLIEPHERFELATFSLRDYCSTPELMRHNVLQSYFYCERYINAWLVAVLNNCAKALEINLIYCKSINSVLPPHIICNKFPPVNLFYSSPSRINVDFSSTNSDYKGSQFNVELIINSSLSQKIITAPCRKRRKSKNTNEFKRLEYFKFKEI